MPLPPAIDWASLDQAARDAAYNNGAAVADSAEVNQARKSASHAFRAAHPAKLDIPYGPAERQCWDLFPAPDPAAPCLVFIHGGYWQYNGREDFAAMLAGAQARGWSVALPGYTLAPHATLADMVAEIHAALDWLGQHGPAHGVAGRVLLSGWSAGGHLAAMALDHPLVVAGMAISGIYDLAPMRDIYVNKLLRLANEDVAPLSPLVLRPVNKPLVIAYGTAELLEMCRQSRDFHAWRSAAHCPGALVPVARADHFRILHVLAEADGELLRAASALL